ncbi:uncharacterized protein A1O9_13078 [Exophiala aquamarina CBS 119918]|uniref:Uncharacterized protein n=1 Tax=Exophiala aquamarina CBS 119918 TaxID=1182545 RepID=A0A072NTC1_9EURO|nr:uncharacterized protein A1O9_13078 [Exophiala aquamarina CBS 119918]KEF50866.1 hypothetical protein A1O9_13078 [Exophiala aquamarina CBS 119918]
MVEQIEAKDLAACIEEMVKLPVSALPLYSPGSSRAPPPPTQDGDGDEASTDDRRRSARPSGQTRDFGGEHRHDGLVELNRPRDQHEGKEVIELARARSTEVFATSNLRLRETTVAGPDVGRGLIKFRGFDVPRLPDGGGDLRNMLFAFCRSTPLHTTRANLSGDVGPIATGRTLLKDNAYAGEFLQVTHTHAAPLHALLALSASYYKELLPLGDVRRKAVEIAELHHLGETVKEVLESIRRGHVDASVAVLAALLDHHAILNRSLHPRCWTRYLYPMVDPRGAKVQANLIMASDAIWAMTFLPLRSKHDFTQIDYHWVGGEPGDEGNRVNGILGLSREMLHYTHSVRVQAITYVNGQRFDEWQAAALQGGVESTVQFVDDSEDEIPKRVAMDTAEAYRFGVLTYLSVRLYGHTPGHPTVQTWCRRLVRQLLKLPIEGEEYSGIHPAWCFAVAGACVVEEDAYATLVGMLERIAAANKSNVDEVSVLVKWVRGWHRENATTHGWWEKMTQDLEVRTERVICLS